MNNQNECLNKAIKNINNGEKNKCCNYIPFLIPPGPPGPPGPATIEIGTVTTGEPGTDAEVVNSGTEENVVLDFTIPQGEVGPAGPQGEAGTDGISPTITVGTVTTGEPGTDAEVVNSGTDENVVLDFTIPQGEVGPAGPQGEVGPAGPQGEAGTDGISPTITVGTVTTGEPGTDAEVVNSGTEENVVLDFTIPRGNDGVAEILNYADFYALMPSDNADTVAPGTDVDFPQDGPSSGTSISRTAASSFNLVTIGTYQVYFNVPVSEAGQLQLTLNDVPLDYTVVGRAAGTSDIFGMFLVETTTANSVLTVRNPVGNPTALTITPLAGGTSPVSAHLIITELS